jgi:transcription-repair coupling factor (superfamily II helicase)
MEILPRILAAKGPLVLAGVPGGFLPWLLTDLARGSKGRAIYIAADEAGMRSAVDTALFCSGN